MKYFTKSQVSMLDKSIKGLLICILLCTVSCQTGNKSGLKGEIRYGEHQTIYLYKHDFLESTLVDSTKIDAKGNLDFKIRIDEPGFYLLLSTYNDFITLLLKPGESYNFYADYSNFIGTYEVEGNKDAQLIRQLDIQLFITQKRIDSLMIIYDSSKDLPDFDYIIPKLDSTYLKIINDQRDSTIAFVIQNYNSLACIYALFQKLDESTYVLNRYRDLQYYNLVYDSLSRRYPDIEIISILKDHIDDIYAYYKSQKLLSMAVESEMGLPEIMLPTPNGDTISLYKTISENNYVLLSFWASWDEISVNANKELLQAYHKYNKQGFTVYQVSFDNEKEQWKRAIKIDELPWINVSDLSYPNSKIVGTYNISSIPANYFINNKGEIVAKNLKKDRLWEHLEKAFID